MRSQTKKISQISLSAIFLLTIFLIGGTQTASAQTGVLCPFKADCEPAYQGFKPYDLPFSTGRQAKFKAGESAESDYFYAVVLQSVAIGFSEGDTCGNFSEAKRLAAQKLFPKNKAFASHYCEIPIKPIRYEGFKDRLEANFLALYAGESETDAAALLKKARIKYPKAQTAKMRVVLDFTNQ